MPTETIACTKCGNTFFWEASRGGKPKYCLRHGRRKVVLRPPREVWDARATGAHLEQLVRLARQLQVEAGSDKEATDKDISYMLHAAMLLDRSLSEALTLIVRHGRSHGASWAQIARASDIGPWLAKKRWSADCPEPARTRAVVSPGATNNPQAGAARQALLDELNRCWERSGLSLQDLSAAAEVPVEVVTDAMSGHGRVPTQSIAGKLYAACGGDPDRLEPLWTAIKDGSQPFPSRMLPPPAP
ncbi:hypothetical protein ACEZCY_29565 [Streptacidiphilus sp. N1-12]|uniref:Helix-turn-helix domain-containing protein n=2 Tax=Streptacidiphilus alkalitolerans TaxID=3342712 RepID=A0ABV6VIB8_9ACTN